MCFFVFFIFFFFFIFSLLLLDFSDLIRSFTIVSRARSACAFHLGQQAFHCSPVVELVLDRCLIIESSSHGQLNLLTRQGAECAVAVHTLDSVARPSLVTFALPILPKLANIGLLLASGIGVAVADVLAVTLLGGAVLLVGPCLAAASLL